MGAGAQVHEIALLVEGDDGVLGQVPDQLHLIGFFLFLHKGDGLFTGQLKALQPQTLLDDLLHFGLDLVQVLLQKGLFPVKIVVKAVVDSGADGQLGLGIQALDGLGQNVGAGVAQGPAAVLMLPTQDLHHVAVLQNGGQAPALAVDVGHQGGFVKFGGMGLRGLQGAGAFFQLHGLAVDGDVHHAKHPFCILYVFFYG